MAQNETNTAPTRRTYKASIILEVEIEAAPEEDIDDILAELLITTNCWDGQDAKVIDDNIIGWDVIEESD